MPKNESETVNVVDRVEGKRDGKKSSPRGASNTERVSAPAALEANTPSSATDAPEVQPVEPEVHGHDLETVEKKEQVEDQIWISDVVTAPGIAPAQILDVESPEDQAQESLADMVGRSAGLKAAMASKSAPPAVASDSNTVANRPTADEKVAFIRGIIIATVAGALDQIGLYLIQHEFGGDFKEALKQDRYKAPLTKLAGHKDMPPSFTRQRLGECVRGASVGTEMEEDLGLKRDSLDFYKRVEASRVKNREQRVELIMRALAEGLTVKKVREEAAKLTGKVTSRDRRLVEVVMKQLVGDPCRPSVQEDTREFLQDKNRLNEVLTAGETAKLLNYCEKFREKTAESQEFLQTLENTLSEIFVEKRQVGESEPEEALSTTSA